MSSRPGGKAREHPAPAGQQAFLLGAIEQPKRPGADGHDPAIRPSVPVLEHAHLLAVEGGGKQLDANGYDLLAVIIGSEGLLGVVTEVTVRILKKPETARALMNWAATEHRISRFISSTTPNNAPSLRVHDKLGFVRTGQIVDGEIIFELRR